MPEFNGYAPLEVTVQNSNVSYNYDESNRKLTIERRATVLETGEIKSSVARDNEYTVLVKYPKIAYDEMDEMDETSVEIKIPIKEYYEGFNNPNTEFSNPYRSNTANDVISAVYYKYTRKYREFIY